MTTGQPPPEFDPEGMDDPGLDIEILRRRREMLFTIAAMVLILGASLTIAFSMLHRKPVDQKALLGAAQQTVREAIGSGFAFSFNDLTATLSDPDANTYSVRGEVVTISPQGKPTWYRFECSLTQRTNGSWSPAKLTLTQR
jgi:hypothetical protein